MTERQAAFVAALVGGAPSATQAAIDAGYSPASAHVAASRLIRRDKVADAISEARSGASRAAGITATQLIEALVETAHEARELKQMGAAVSAYKTLLDKIVPDVAPEKALTLAERKAAIAKLLGIPE